MDVYVIIAGESYNLNDASLCKLVAHDGLGPSPVHRISERGPEQHGDSDLGFRLDPRFFSLVFSVSAADRSDLWDKRDVLLRYIRPMNAAALFKFVLESGVTRQIDAHSIGGTFSLDADNVFLLSKIGVQYRADDPTFYDPIGESITFALGGGAGMDVPLTVPLGVGASTLDVVKTIEYPGSWHAYPAIRIVGPITNPKIENETTDEKLDFTGITIQAGEYYDIDTRYGYKTVVDDGDVNKIADLTSDSDLTTFHLEATQGGLIRELNAPLIKANDIRVTGTSATEATEVYFQYKIRYIGI